MAFTRADRLNHPDRLIFDLDPPRNDFQVVRFAARTLRAARELGLDPLLMATGGRGLHLVVPLDRRADFDAVRSFARDVAEFLAARHKDRLTTEELGRTSGAAVCSSTTCETPTPRRRSPLMRSARPGAPVAVPLAWDAALDPDLRGGSWNTDDRLAPRTRRSMEGDDATRRSLSPRKKLDKLLSRSV